MRTPRYRAWIEYAKAMRPVTEIQWSSMGIRRVSFIGHVPRAYLPSGGQTERVCQLGGDKVVLMQFTGLRDAKGADIYEGDIVAYGQHYSGDHLNSPGKSKVVYEDGGFNLDSWNTESLSHLVLNNLCEVVGDIYQNGDLLEAQS